MFDMLQCIWADYKWLILVVTPCTDTFKIANPKILKLYIQMYERILTIGNSSTRTYAKVKISVTKIYITYNLKHYPLNKVL